MGHPRTELHCAKQYRNGVTDIICPDRDARNSSEMGIQEGIAKTVQGSTRAPDQTLELLKAIDYVLLIKESTRQNYELKPQKQ